MGAMIELPKLYNPDFAVPNRKPVGAVEIEAANRAHAGWLLRSDLKDIAKRNDLINYGASISRNGLKFGPTATYAQSIKNGPSGTGDISVFFRMRTTQSGIANHHMINIGEAATNKMLVVIRYGDGLKVGGWGFNVFSTGTYNNGEWHNCLLVYNGANLSLYVDGNLDVTSTTYTNLNITALPVHIGSYRGLPTDTSFAYNGDIDQIHIFARSFTNAEARLITKDFLALLRPSTPYLFPATGGGLSAVSTQIDLRWQIAQLVNQSADLQWTITNTVSRSTDLQWAALNTIGQSADLRWALLSAVNNSVDLRWDILAALQLVSQSVDIRWDMLQQAAQSTDLRWRILSLVFADTDLRWALLNNVSKQGDFRYSILEQVAQVIDLRWDTLSALSSVGKSVDLRWDILAFVSQSLNAQWSALELVSNDADLQWQVAVLVSKDIELQWALKQTAGQAVEIQWDVLARTSNSIDLRWTIISNNSFPDITGTITLQSRTPITSLTSATKKITLQ